LTFFDILVRKGLFFWFFPLQRNEEIDAAEPSAEPSAEPVQLEIDDAPIPVPIPAAPAAPAAPWQVEQVERLRLPTAVPEHLGGFGADWSRL